MDSSDKSKYVKSKYLVKKWEEQFKKIKGVTPSKVDIKAAPIKIKEAYKMYWHLKTFLLENTVIDSSIIDENASDSFNLSQNCLSMSQIDNSASLDESSNFFKPLTEESQLTVISPFKNLNQTVEEVHTKKGNIILDGKIDAEKYLKKSYSETNVIPLQHSPNKNIENVKKVNDNVWGDHLKVKNIKKNKLERSISFQYSKKLFSGSKFSMRNPRKPNNFSRHKTFDDSLDDMSSSTSLNQVTNLQNCIESLTTQVSSVNEQYNSLILNENENKNFDLSTEKVKIVIKSTPQNSNAFNVLQKNYSTNQTNDSLNREINKGWLERINDTKNIENNLLTGSGFRTPNDENKLTTNISTNSLQNYSSSLSLHRSGESANNSEDDVIYGSDNEAESSSTFSLLQYQLGSEAQSKNNNSVKKIKLDDRMPDCHKSLFFKTDSERKMELLEKKLESGQANENFIRINLKKKRYVRGKKKMNLAHYKEKQWKLQNSLNKTGRKRIRKGVFKCSKCGDIGHWAKNCVLKNDDLIPVDEDLEKMEEESPNLSLLDAEKLNTKKLNNTCFNTNKAETTINKRLLENITECHIKCIEALYQIDDKDVLMDTPSEVLKVLKDFGYTKFHDGQEEAVMRILCGQSVFLEMPTGGGKSLCYQIPAFLYHKHRNKAITLVVSPLISLMEDQVNCYSGMLKIACYHSNQTETQRQKILDLLSSHSLSVLLITPETLTSNFAGLTTALFSKLPKVAFVCIDEAHCLSQWSYNFRPSYLSICQILREKLGVKIFLGLTATATLLTCRRVLEVLSSNCYKVSSGKQLPHNLILSASYVENDRKESLVKLLKSQRFLKYSSIIIYCSRRKICDEIASFLRISLQTNNESRKNGKLSIDVEVYHAGLSASRRKTIQKGFLSGNIKIIIATMAFGMGINKNNIRGIIHYNIPASFENYVQEIGRAGRDGLPAFCHLFMEKEGKDLSELRRHIYSNGVDRATLRKLVNLIYKPCSRDFGTCSTHEIAFSIQDTINLLDLKEENISTLLRYLEYQNERWKIICLPHCYINCRVTSYKGRKHLEEVAATCGPLAAALAKTVKCQTSVNQNNFEFNIIDLANSLQLESNLLKKTFKNLEWDNTSNKVCKSGIIVQFTNLGFRLKACGNLTETELDNALNVLHKAVNEHQISSLKQLELLHNSLKSISYKTVDDYLKNIDENRSEKLKEEVKNYFYTENPLENVILESFLVQNESTICDDIRQLISMNRDKSLSGRSIARIFHGIESPNFPAFIWGRTRFWRLHLNQDFNSLSKLATRQLIIFR